MARERPNDPRWQLWDTTRDTEVELQLWTREGPTIAGLVVEYINTIMEDRATPALPKRSQGTSALSLSMCANRVCVVASS